MEDSWAHNLMSTHNVEDYDWSLDLHSDDFKYLSSLPEISEFDLLTLKNTKYNKTVGSTRVDTQDDEDDICSFENISWLISRIYFSIFLNKIFPKIYSGKN